MSELGQKQTSSDLVSDVRFGAVSGHRTLGSNFQGSNVSFGAYSKHRVTLAQTACSWSSVIGRRQSAIQHIGPDNVFLPGRYFLASMNAMLGMHAMGEAQDRPLWCMNWDN